MQYETASEALTQKAFEFFFWFSRFEAALKECGFLKNETEGALAEPSWEKFTDAYASNYKLTASGKALIKLAPERQVVGVGKTLAWCQVRIEDCPTELGSV